MRLLRGVQAGALILALGCSGESVTPPANLSGSWAFVFNGANDAGVKCTSTMTITISQTDQTFVGFQRGAGTVSCTGVVAALVSPNPSNPQEIDNEMISSGVVGQNDVSFATALLTTTNSGAVIKDGQMSGTTIWQVPVEPRGAVTVTGTWTATRQ